MPLNFLNKDSSSGPVLCADINYSGHRTQKGSYDERAGSRGAGWLKEFLKALKCEAFERLSFQKEELGRRAESRSQVSGRSHGGGDQLTRS